MSNIKLRVAAIIIQDNKILMLRGKGFEELWTPGGKTEEDESDLECLSRELEEEIQVKLMDATFFKEYATRSYYNPESALIERVYVAVIEGRIKPSAEIKDFIWFSRADYENGNYPMISHTQKDLIPDLISESIWM